MDSNEPLTYVSKTKDFDHQAATIGAVWTRESFAIFWEQGLGKTKHVLDNAAALYEAGEIDCLFVVAPNGVHRNWIVEEIEKHFSDRVMAKVKGFAYHSSKVMTKKHQKAAKEILAHKGLVVIAISYSAFMTKAGKPYAKKVLTQRKCFYVLDESAFIKTPGAKRTKSIVASGRYAKYKRILTGTPVANRPFDIYCQMRFLDPDFWKVRGLGNYNVFKNYFALWKDQILESGRTFPMLLAYKNLEELHDMIKDDSSRILKEDALDLPPKLYTKRFFDMSPKQAKLYTDLRDNYIADIDHAVEDANIGAQGMEGVSSCDGSTESMTRSSVTAELAITRMLRLQQITSGFVAVEEKHIPDPENPDYFEYVPKVIDIEEGKNLRLKLLEEIIETLEGKAIIWARFTREIDMIMGMLGDHAVRYDGSTKTDARGKAIDAFQEKYEPGGPQFFVANAAAAGTGLTLTKATTTIYYSNNFKLEERLQSEDRNHRIGTVNPVTYIDLICNDTIDLHIVNALIEKLDVSRIIMGDAVREWL